MSSWQDREPMMAFVNSEPHLGISQRLVATLTQPSPANSTWAFPPPVQAPSGG